MECRGGICAECLEFSDIDFEGVQPDFRHEMHAEEQSPEQEK